MCKTAARELRQSYTPQKSEEKVSDITIKTNFELNDDVSKELMRQFILTLSGGREPTVGSFNNIGMESETLMFIVSGLAKNDAEEFIYKLMDHKSIPFEGFEAIEDWDYDVAVMSTLVDPMQELVNQRKFEQLDEKTALLNTALEEVNGKMEALDLQMGRVMGLLQSSGVMHYREFMQAFLSAMEDRGVIDKDTVEKRMFQTHH